MKDANLSNTVCQLWVLVDDPSDIWWQKINFNSGFLLSKVNQFKKTQQPLELAQLVKDVNFPTSSPVEQKPWTLIGCRNHFDADWIFLIHNLNKFNLQDLSNAIEQLQITSLRCFAPFEPPPSLRSRLEHCDLVSHSTN